MKKDDDYSGFFQSEKSIMFRESALEQLSKREELDSLFVHYNIPKYLIYSGYGLLITALVLIIFINI